MWDVNLNCIYLQRYIMSHFSSKFRLCVKTLRSANPWMNVPKWNKLQLQNRDFPCSGSREQWTLCREHVNRNTVHARSSLLSSWWSESSVLTKRDMQNMQSGGCKDWNWEPLAYIMCHSPERKHYSTVSLFIMCIYKYTHILVYI